MPFRREVSDVEYQGSPAKPGIVGDFVWGVGVALDHDASVRVYGVFDEGEGVGGGERHERAILAPLRTRGALRPARASNGYRLFSADDVRRVELIRTLQGVGFSLAEIRELAPCWRDDRTPHDRPIAELRVMFQTKLTEMDRHVAQLTSVRAELARRLADLDPTLTTEMRAH